ncbi:hypothetical protein HMI51_04270 [Corallococcus coralloides]|nr:hypothetical protein [Corallococcus coralloides]
MSTVFIWNNNAVTFGRSYPGHASLNIDGIWPQKYATNHEHRHVSWFPGNNQSHSGHDQADPKLNVLQDLVAEGYAPDHIIRIPSNGIQEPAMRAAWDEIRNKAVVWGNVAINGANVAYRQNNSGASYRFLVKNCSVIVQRVLKAANFRSSNWDFVRMHSAIWTPLNVKRMALCFTGAHTITWANFVGELRIANTLTQLEHDTLVNFQRRHDRHGSSGAPARNQSNHPTFVRPHWWGNHQSAAGNAAIVNYIQHIGDNPRAGGH